MSRIHSLDYLKLALAVLVAFGHTYWLQSHANTLTFLLGNGLMRVMVPAFCIVAGFFLYSAAARGKGAKWLWRATALYIFWMAIYLPFWLNEVHDLVSLVKTLLLGFFHLWFMAGIIVAGVMILGLRWLSRVIGLGTEVPLLVAVVAVCAVAGVAMQYANLSGLAQIGVRKFENGIFMCFPFVAIGYLLRRRLVLGGPLALPGRSAVLVALAVGTVLLLGEAWLVQARWGVSVMLDIPLTAYLAAPALFLAVLETQMPEPPIRLDPISGAIYFMHVLVLKLAAVLGVSSLGALMLLAVGLPTLAALGLGALRVPGFVTGAPQQAGTGSDTVPLAVRQPRTGADA